MIIKVKPAITCIEPCVAGEVLEVEDLSARSYSIKLQQSRNRIVVANQARGVQRQALLFAEVVNGGGGATDAC